MLVDKRKPSVWQGLLATCHMNLQRERDQVTYKHMHGDKETFWLGFSLMDSEFSFTRFLPGMMGIPSAASDLARDVASKSANASANDTAANVICGTQMTHFDWRGRPLWYNNWITVSKFDRKSPVAPMTHWLREPGAWELGMGNRACIRITAQSESPSPTALTAHELFVLKQSGIIWQNEMKLVH